MSANSLAWSYYLIDRNIRIGILIGIGALIDTITFEVGCLFKRGRRVLNQIITVYKEPGFFQVSLNQLFATSSYVNGVLSGSLNPASDAWVLLLSGCCHIMVIHFFREEAQRSLCAKMNY